MTRQDYIELTGSLATAMEFETATLSVGGEFLPSFAKAVRDGAAPTDAYWQWLCEQWAGFGVVFTTRNQDDPQT